MKFAFLIL